MLNVRFEQSTYSVDENAGAARPVLVLSNTSSTDITVEVFDTSGSATSEYYISQCWVISRFH